MFDGVRHVNFVAIDPGFDERFVQQPSCRADEWFTREVFVVAGLLADEHDLRVARAFAEDRLRAGFPERTGLASARGLLKFRDGWSRRNERLRRFFRLHA